MSEDESGDDTHRYYALVNVLDDDGDPGQHYNHRENVQLVKCDTDRNMWDLYVHEDWVAAFDADDFTSTGVLGKWLDRILVAYESAEEDEQEEIAQERDLDGVGGGAFQ